MSYCNTRCPVALNILHPLNLPRNFVEFIAEITMPGTTVRDVDAQKFVEAYAAFLKRQGKLPVPGRL
jgi:hypothetical protein